MTLKFGLLARVSTEAQEKHGVSLITQISRMRHAVHSVSGNIVREYCGQEHSSPGSDRVMLRNLVSDIKHKIINAVMVDDISRIGRDKVESEKFYKALKVNNVRLFILSMEFDLSSPEQTCMLSLQSVFAQFQSDILTQKSLTSKIALARQGYPSSGGRLPYGRTFSKLHGWGIDSAKQKEIVEMVQKIVEDNWTCMKVALFYGIRPSVLNKRLKRLGSSWTQKFNSNNSNIHEEVETEIPPLIPDSLNALLLEKLKGNQTYLRTGIKYDYLLSRKIYNRQTRQSLTSHTTVDRGKQYRYYRSQYEHKQSGYDLTVKADLIEQCVLSNLSDLFNYDKNLFSSVLSFTQHDGTEEIINSEIRSAKNQLNRLQKDIEQRILYLPDDSIENISFSRKLFQDTLQQLENEMLEQHKLLKVLETKKKSLCTPKQISSARIAYKDHISRLVEYNFLTSQLVLINLDYNSRRKVVDLMLGGQDESGKKYGVYIEKDPKNPNLYLYEIFGRFGTIIADTASAEDVGIFNQSKFDPDTSRKISNIILDGYAFQGVQDELYSSNTESSPRRNPAERDRRRARAPPGQTRWARARPAR